MAKRTEGDDVEQRQDPGQEAVRAAASDLYATDPDRFLAARGELVARARQDGEAEVAKQIGKLRKPTVAAWIVNRLVHDDGQIVDRLLDLNARLRAAQEDLDAEQLRTLSAERRELVGRLTRDALAAAGRRDAAAQLRDEILSTFDAAVADPSIATELGRLQKSRSWSGFGLAAPAGPQLTVVRGGKATRQEPPSGTRPAKPETQAGAARKPPSRAAADAKERALSKARKVRDESESAVDAAEAQERACTDQVRSLTGELSRLQADLDKAKAQLEDARRAVKSARARRREAQAAVNRAERAAGT